MQVLALDNRQAHFQLQLLLIVQNRFKQLHTDAICTGISALHQSLPSLIAAVDPE
ncbi:hypothetical protein D3C75_1198530 [compost metagenome]